MRLCVFLNENKKGKRMLLGGTVVTLTGRTKIRGGRTMYQVLVPWTDAQKKKRKKLELGEPYDGLYQYAAEDQLKDVK